MTQKISDFKRDQQSLLLQRASQRQDLASNYEGKMREKLDLNSNELVKSRVIYNELCDRYNNKELQKDRNYQNYYREIDTQQRNLQELHKEMVISPQNQKQQYLDHIIEKGIEEKQRTAAEKEQQKQSTMLRNLSDMSMTNRQRMDLEQYRKSLNAEERRLKDETRIKELNDYNEFLSQESVRKKNIQYNYKLELERQALEQKKIKSVSVSMSPLEKRINYPDLQSFKSYDPTLHALIPGWSPQIGGMPLKAQQKDLGRTLRVRTEPDGPEMKITSQMMCSPKLANEYKGIIHYLFWWFGVSLFLLLNLKTFN